MEEKQSKAKNESERRISIIDMVTPNNSDVNEDEDTVTINGKKAKIVKSEKPLLPHEFMMYQFFLDGTTGTILTYVFGGAMGSYNTKGINLDGVMVDVADICNIYGLNVEFVNDKKL